MREPGRFTSSRFSSRADDPTGVPAQTAPVVNTATISPSATPTGVLTANISASGNPVPEILLIQWQESGEDIPGATGPSFTKDDVVEPGDVIGFRYVVSNGVLPDAIGSSQNTVTITALPEITASPPALTAGQQATIPFNTDIEAKNLSITQGGTALTATRVGTTNEWTFTPLTTQPVNISATKAGWTPYSVVIENVQAAAPVLVVSPTNEFVINNMDENSDPEPFTVALPVEDAGTRTIDPAALSDGPEPYIQPTYAIVGNEFVIDPKVWVSPRGKVNFQYSHLRNGVVIPGALEARRAKEAADGGATVSATITGVDSRGDTEIALPGIAVPSSADTFDAPNGTLALDYQAPSGRTFNSFGASNADSGVILDGFLVSSDDNDYRFVAVNEPSVANYKWVSSCRSVANTTVTGWYDRGLMGAVAVKSVNTGFTLFNNGNDGRLVLRKYANGVVTTAAQSAPGTSIPINTDYTAVYEVEGETLTVTVGSIVLTVTDPDVAGGVRGYFYQRGALPAGEYNKVNSFDVEQ